MPERSKGMIQTKRDTLVLQVGGWAQGQPHSPGKNALAKKSQPGKAGRINGHRPRRVKRNMNLWITLAQDRRRWKELVEKAKTLH
jgi:hypothetical protein